MNDGRQSSARYALIVDDDKDIRATLRWLLEDAGYQVVEAVEGGAALKVLRTTPHHMVVLLDLMMPNGIDGESALLTAAQDAKLISQHSFILMTAAATTLRLAFVTLLSRLEIPVLHKPFDVDDALALVEAATQRLR